MDLQRTTALQEPLVHAVAEESLLRERVLETSIRHLDDLIGGFRSASVTLFDSDNAYPSDLLNMLCVRAVSEFDEEVVWIDGGNTIDPYAMSSLCKRLRIDKRDVLSRVNLSRAFTAYQLVTLIDERLEEQVLECRPSTVFVSSITGLFLDKDMKWMESHQLLRRCLENISRITKENETISFVTNHAHQPLRPSPKLTSLLYEHADVVVQMRLRRDGMLFRLPRLERETVFSPVPWNQLTLDEFRGDLDRKDRGHIPLGP